MATTSGRSDTLVFGLVGDPVAHSLSPAIHEAAFRALGLRAEYRLVHVRREDGDLEGAIRALAASGGGNVTVPHKQRAAELLERPSEEVRSIGACNCFWLDSDGRLAGDDTDVEGILGALGRLPGPRLDDGARAVVLGAGGAARAAVRALLRAGAGQVDVWNRTPERAEGLATHFGADGRVRALALPPSSDPPVAVVIQATSLGLEPSDPMPPDPALLRPGCALDLVYAPGSTRWARRAAQAGVPVLDGREVLLGQGALSLRRWLGVEPPIDAMREALQREMRRRGEPPAQ
jgi:shikimate dehydrogenase